LLYETMETSNDTNLAGLLGASLSGANLPPILNAEQAAALLYCTKEHLETLAQAGEVPAARIGRGWIFLTPQLLSWLVERCGENLTRPRARRAWHSHDAKQEAAHDADHQGLSVTVGAPRKPRGRPRNRVPLEILNT
jgi:excisionase family DNA binding protein